MSTTTFTCPHCGKLAQTDMDVYQVEVAAGCPPAYFPLEDLLGQRERHIDTRVCCQECWDKHGARSKLLGEPHPFSGRSHEARRAATVGTFPGGAGDITRR